jgi:hypothetical protein
LFEKEVEDKIQNEKLGLMESYLGQLPNLVVRLSCLYRLSRMTAEEIKIYNKPVLTVEMEDVERAKGYAMKAWDWFGKVIEIMQSAQKTGPLFPKESAKNAILECLSDGSEKHVNVIKTYVIERTGASQATFYTALRLLLDARKVERTRPDYYRIVKKEDGGAEGEKK